MQGRGRGWLLASLSLHSCCGLCLGWWQEDNHNYYVSRLYGPSEPRSRELWVDMAKANQSQVKVHRILSNTHRQASVSMPVPGSAALGREAGGQGPVPNSGRDCGLRSMIWEVPFRGPWGAWPELRCQPVVLGACLGPACPWSCADKRAAVWVSNFLAYSLPMLILSYACREWSCLLIFLSMGILCDRSP